ncbi:MAG: hypothetical protein ACFFED_10335 [Candidatus Thorarchaeota archaeon]
MNDEDLTKIEQNAMRDSMKDGISEILAGLIFLYSAIVFRNPVFISMYVVFYILFLPKLMEGIRQRYTYPRLGYVKLRTKGTDLNFGAFILLLVLMLLTSGIAVQLLTGDILNLANWVIIFPFTFGFLMLGASSYLVEKTGSKLYWLFGILTTSLGLAIAILSVAYPPADYYDGILIYCLLLGAILGTGGIFKFLYFTHSYPILESPEDEGTEQR